MKKYLLIVFSFSVLLFSSCGNFQDITFVGIDNIKVNKISRQGVDVDITAKIKNPNNIAFTVYESDLDATVSGMNMGKASLTKNVKIKANSEEGYIFNIKSDFSNISLMELPGLMAIISSKNVKIGLKGNLKAGKLFVKKSYPVDFVKNVPLDLNGL